MSKRKKERESSKLIDRVLFGVTLETLSEEANRHNIRGVQITLKDLGIDYVKLDYIVEGVNKYAFQTKYTNKDIVKKVCSKYGTEFVLACMGTKNRYGVFKEDVGKSDRDKDGIGWIVPLTKEEAEKQNTYFSDGQGHYFVINNEKVA